MLKEYKLQAILGIWGGIFFVLFGYLISPSESSYRYFGHALMVGGYVLLVCGAVMYARGKGYRWVVGLCGICGPLGLLILYALRDRSAHVLKKRQKEE